MLSSLRSQKDGSRVLRVAILAVVLLCAAGAMSMEVGWLGLRSGASAGVSPAPVSQIPSSLPAGGVEIQGQGIVLTPWTSAPSGAMSADDAITAARVIDDNATGFPAAALQAELTLRGSIPSSPNDAGSHSPIDRVPVWLVTFTSPKPVDVSAGLAPVYVTHDSVAIDPASGEFVLGFYTP